MAKALVDQPTPTPTRKVAAGGAAGAITILLVWAAGEFASITVPPEVASAFTTVISFLAAYLTRNEAV